MSGAAEFFRFSGGEWARSSLPAAKNARLAFTLLVTITRSIHAPSSQSPRRASSFNSLFDTSKLRTNRCTLHLSHCGSIYDNGGATEVEPQRHAQQPLLPSGGDQRFEAARCTTHRKAGRIRSHPPPRYCCEASQPFSWPCTGSWWSHDHRHLATADRASVAETPRVERKPHQALASAGRTTIQTRREIARQSKFASRNTSTRVEVRILT